MFCKCGDAKKRFRFEHFGIRRLPDIVVFFIFFAFSSAQMPVFAQNSVPKQSEVSFEYASIWHDPNGMVTSFRVPFNLVVPFGAIDGSVGNLAAQHPYASALIKFADLSFDIQTEHLALGMGITRLETPLFSGNYGNTKIALKNGSALISQPSLTFFLPKNVELTLSGYLCKTSWDFSEFYYLNATPALQSNTAQITLKWKRFKTSFSFTNSNLKLYDIDSVPLVQAAVNTYAFDLQYDPFGLGFVLFDVNALADFKSLSSYMWWPFVSLTAEANGFAPIGFIRYFPQWRFDFFALELDIIGCIGSVPDSFLHITFKQKKLFGGGSLDEKMVKPLYLTGGAVLAYVNAAFIPDENVRLGIKKTFAYGGFFPVAGSTVGGGGGGESWFSQLSTAEIIKLICLSGLSLYCKIVW